MSPCPPATPELRDSSFQQTESPFAQTTISAGLWASLSLLLAPIFLFSDKEVGPSVFLSLLKLILPLDKHIKPASSDV